LWEFIRCEVFIVSLQSALWEPSIEFSCTCVFLFCFLFSREPRPSSQSPAGSSPEPQPRCLDPKLGPPLAVEESSSEPQLGPSPLPWSPSPPPKAAATQAVRPGPRPGPEPHLQPQQAVEGEVSTGVDRIPNPPAWYPRSRAPIQPVLSHVSSYYFFCSFIFNIFF
jgi:hypothetical protein